MDDAVLRRNPRYIRSSRQRPGSRKSHPEAGISFLLSRRQALITAARLRWRLLATRAFQDTFRIFQNDLNGNALRILHRFVIIHRHKKRFTSFDYSLLSFCVEEMRPAPG